MDQINLTPCVPLGFNLGYFAFSISGVLGTELCPSPISYVAILTPGTPHNVTIIGERAFEGVIKVKWSHRAPIWLVSLWETERHQGCSYTEERPAIYKPRAEAWEETKPEDTCISDFSGQNEDKINFWCSGPLACGLVYRALANKCSVQHEGPPTFMQRIFECLLSSCIFLRFIGGKTFSVTLRALYAFS